MLLEIRLNWGWMYMIQLQTNEYTYLLINKTIKLLDVNWLYYRDKLIQWEPGNRHAVSSTHETTQAAETNIQLMASTLVCIRLIFKGCNR